MKQVVVIAVLLVVLAVVQTKAFKLHFTCYSVRNSTEKRNECLKCFNETMKSQDDTALNDEAKKCTKDMPDPFKKCCDEPDDKQRICFKKAYIGWLRFISKAFWNAWRDKISPEQRGCAKQFIGLLVFLHDIRNKLPEKFEQINKTITPCREDFLSKMRSKRNADEEATPESRKGSSETNQYYSKDDEIEEGERLLKKITLICDYVKCKLEKIKNDPESLATVKEHIKTFSGNIPAMLIAIVFKECLQ